MPEAASAPVARAEDAAVEPSAARPVAPPVAAPVVATPAAAAPIARGPSTAGDRLTAVLVRQPADRCGRTLRALRAWVTPATDDARWLVTGEPPPAAARPL